MIVSETANIKVCFLMCGQIRKGQIFSLESERMLNLKTVL